MPADEAEIYPLESQGFMRDPSGKAQIAPEGPP